MEHKRIWLQMEDDPPTWCQHRVNPDDIEYVRVDEFLRLYSAAWAVLDGIYGKDSNEPRFIIDTLDARRKSECDELLRICGEIAEDGVRDDGGAWLA